MEKSTKKKWLWGIGVVVVLAAIGSMQEKKEGSESKTPQQIERIVEQPQETEAERQEREKKEEAERQAQEQKAEAERLAREQKEEANRQEREQKEKQEKKNNILKEGYDRGYKDAIQFTYYSESNYRIAFTNLYGVPQNDEEIALFKQYKEQYDKGWNEGRKIKNKMNE